MLIAELVAGRWMTDFWDDRLPGFAVRAHQSGTKFGRSTST